MSLKKGHTDEAAAELDDLKAALALQDDLDEHQQLIVQACVRSVIPHIYGARFMGEKKRLVEENGMEDISEYCLIQAPRRWGKTYAIIGFLASLMITGMDYDVLYLFPQVYPIPYFIAKMENLCRSTKGKEMGYSHSYTVASDTNALTVTNGRGGTNQIRFYPKMDLEKLKKARGLAPNLLILEESYEWLTDELYLTTILPLVSKGHISVIAISSNAIDSLRLNNLFATQLATANQIKVTGLTV